MGQLCRVWHQPPSVVWEQSYSDICDYFATLGKTDSKPATAGSMQEFIDACG